MGPRCGSREHGGPLVPGLLVTAQAAMAAAVQGSHYKGAALPWFALAFIALMLLNGTRWVSRELTSGMSGTSRAILVIAIAGVDLKTSLKDVAQLGWRPGAMIFLVTPGLAGLTGGYLTATR
jgi:uncharacterized membrane protein YadS